MGESRRGHAAMEGTPLNVRHGDIEESFGNTCRRDRIKQWLLESVRFAEPRKDGKVARPVGEIVEASILVLAGFAWLAAMTLLP
jgi:hypothetical protein